MSSWGRWGQIWLWMKNRPKISYNSDFILGSNLKLNRQLCRITYASKILTVKFLAVSAHCQYKSLCWLGKNRISTHELFIFSNTNRCRKQYFYSGRSFIHRHWSVSNWWIEWKNWHIDGEKKWYKWWEKMGFSWGVLFSDLIKWYWSLDRLMFDITHSACVMLYETPRI